MVGFGSEREFRGWLLGKPEEWLRILSRRIALRSIPAAIPLEHSLISQGDSYANYLITLFRSAVILNAAHIFSKYSSESIKSKLINSLREAQLFSAYLNLNSNSARAILLPSIQLFQSNLSSVKIGDFSFQVALQNTDLLTCYHGLNLEDQSDKNEILSIVKSDCETLLMGKLYSFDRRPIWIPNKNPFASQLDLIRQSIQEHHPSFTLWLNWYDRIVSGGEAQFGTSADHDFYVYEQLILQNDAWWKRHPEMVNEDIQAWIDDKNAKFVWERPDEDSETTQTPPQQTGATAYGVNEQGKLDRLPSSDQVHLRDVSDQRRAYADMREAAAALIDEGQRLGHRLKRALDRFLQSVPERFNDAEAYLVWRDANALRRLHRAHREAAKTSEPDEAKLEPVIAEGLGGLLDLYNNFAFADDGLRAKDEARIAPQERVSAEAEAKAAIPLVEAILANPEIATPEALDDIMADAENAEMSADDPYTAQVLDQSSRTKRNLFAGLISDTWAAFKNANPLVQGLAGNLAYDGLKIVTKTVAGIDYAPLLEFIATHAPLMQDYAAIAFSNYPQLPELIEQIRVLWSRYKL
jgi:hypothetical protein